jgi:hypothetical protein
MYVTRRVSQGNFNAPYNGFPDVSGVNQMQRVNLRAGEWPPRQVVVPDFQFDPSASTAAGYFAPNSFHYVPASVPNSVGPMGKLQADYIFTAPDDLVFEKNEGQPGSAAAPLPIQQMAKDKPGAAGTPIARQTDGAFNWMATLVPKSPQDRSEYILSIVVYHNRPINVTPNPSHDRVVQINDGSGSAPNTNFYSQGVGGGDVRITRRSMMQPLSDLDVRRGQWVLLTPSTNVSYFRWYRVIEADYELDSNDGRLITLQGEDWPMSPPWAGGGAAGFAFPYVIIPPNVVAVFSRSVRFEETTAWYE